MSTEKMREELEKSPRFRGMDFQRDTEARDYYLSPYANGAWDGWKASRESLAIDLPKPLPSGDYRMTVPFYKAADIIEALSAAGIEVKA
jgi:hypothetical protein